MSKLPRMRLAPLTPDVRAALEAREVPPPEVLASMDDEHRRLVRAFARLSVEPVADTAAVARKVRRP